MKTRAGLTPRPIDGFQIPHQDGAGVIDTAGPGVRTRAGSASGYGSGSRRGRRWGTAAHWAVVPERQAVPLPEGVSSELGAQLGVPAVTAHRCLFADGPVAGKTLLVAGGAGAVGHFAVELGRWGGAAEVVATASGPAKADLARKAGAGYVINYKDADAASQIQAARPGRWTGSLRWHWARTSSSTWPCPGRTR